jgi:biotin transport system substrate-specific component
MSVLSLTPSPSLATSILGDDKTSLLNNVFLILAGSVLIALSAQVSVPLPFTPVPISGQTFGVLVIGMALGSRRGALAVIAYLIEGGMGAPVFAGGAGGAGILVGPTAGYLFGFIPAAFITGYLAENGWDRNPISTVVAMLAGNAAIYIPGLIVLATMLSITPANTLVAGFFPFLPGDLVKLALAAGMMPLAWKFLGRK